MNRLTIVVVMVLEHRVGRVYAGRPVGRQKVERTAQAAVWLSRGSDEDMKAAVAWAAREGFQAYAYPVDEPDPLGRGKADALADANTVAEVRTRWRKVAVRCGAAADDGPTGVIGAVPARPH